jgi:hypothetical protein
MDECSLNRNIHDVIFLISSWYSFSSMNRIFKHYDFQTKSTPGTVRGKQCSRPIHIAGKPTESRYLKYQAWNHFLMSFTKRLKLAERQLGFGSAQTVRKRQSWQRAKAIS